MKYHTTQIYLALKLAIDIFKEFYALCHCAFLSYSNCQHLLEKKFILSRGTFMPPLRTTNRIVFLDYKSTLDISLFFFLQGSFASLAFSLATTTATFNKHYKNYSGADAVVYKS